LLETNKTQGEVPESLEPYEGLLVPPDAFWVSPLCRWWAKLSALCPARREVERDWRDGTFS